MQIKLYYPSILADRKPRAWATAEARETKTQYVVKGADVKIISGGKFIRFGSIEARFWKKNGMSVGYSTSWRVLGPIAVKLNKE